jgi:hypothetical protein
MLPKTGPDTPDHDTGCRREPPVRIDTENTDSQIKAHPHEWESLVRQPLSIGFHLTLGDLLTQLEHWITDHTR